MGGMVESGMRLDAGASAVEALEAYIEAAGIVLVKVCQCPVPEPVHPQPHQDRGRRREAVELGDQSL